MAAKTRERKNQVLKGPHGGIQLVLTEDVPHLGKQGEMVEVKPGFARNYLLPRGLGTLPTAHNIRLLERYKIRVKLAHEARVAEKKSLAEQLEKMPGITIEVNATDDGHLYGSVGPVEISRGLKAKALPVDPDMVQLDEPLKELGLFAVSLNLGFEITSEVKVLVSKKTPDKK